MIRRLWWPSWSKPSRRSPESGIALCAGAFLATAACGGPSLVARSRRARRRPRMRRSQRTFPGSGDVIPADTNVCRESSVWTIPVYPGLGLGPRPEIAPAGLGVRGRWHGEFGTHLGSCRQPRRIALSGASRFTWGREQTASKGSAGTSPLHARSWDYRTTEELEERNGDSRNAAGDIVSVQGTVVAEEGLTYRIAPRSAPLVEIEQLERRGAANSLAVVKERRRADTFQERPDPNCLKAILRVPPLPGPGNRGVRSLPTLRRPDAVRPDWTWALWPCGRVRDTQVSAFLPCGRAIESTWLACQPAKCVRGPTENVITINPFFHQRTDCASERCGVHRRQREFFGSRGNGPSADAAPPQDRERPSRPRGSRRHVCSSSRKRTPLPCKLTNNGVRFGLPVA